MERHARQRSRTLKSLTAKSHRGARPAHAARYQRLSTSSFVVNRVDSEFNNDESEDEFHFVASDDSEPEPDSNDEYTSEEEWSGDGLDSEDD